ncbi:MAG: hypothetical protein WKG00_15880 [Polyangiaceae bacterium]
MDRRHLEIASGPGLGFALWALVDAVAIAASVSLPAEGFGLRALHHLFASGQTLALGLVLGAVLLAGAAVARGRWPMVVAYALGTMGVMHAMLGPDLERQAEIIADGQWSWALRPLYVVLCGLAIPAAHVLGTVVGERWPRLALLLALAGLGGMVTNQLVLRDDYPAVHAAIGWASATLAGAAVAGRVVRRVERLGRRSRLAFGAAALAELLLALYPPPNGVRRELFRQPGAASAWLLAAAFWSPPSIRAAAPADPGSPIAPPCRTCRRAMRRARRR